jgi:hypothetical protein
MMCSEEMFDNVRGAAKPQERKELPDSLEKGGFFETLKDDITVFHGDGFIRLSLRLQEDTRRAVKQEFAGQNWRSVFFDKDTGELTAILSDGYEKMSKLISIIREIEEATNETTEAIKPQEEPQELKNFPTFKILQGESVIFYGEGFFTFHTCFPDNFRLLLNQEGVEQDGNSAFLDMNTGEFTVILRDKRSDLMRLKRSSYFI